MLMRAIIVAIAATLALASPAYAQCAGGDWRCQHNEFHNRMMDGVARGPGVLDWLQFFSQQSAIDQQRKELERQRAVKVDALKQALAGFDGYGPADRAMMCQQIYPAALNQGLLDVPMGREFWRRCAEPRSE